MVTEDQMLPDQTPEVTPPTEAVSQDVKTQTDQPGLQADAPEGSVPPEGYVHYARLKEEIKKRKDLEKQLEDLQASDAPTIEDEEPEQNSELLAEIKALREERAWDRLAAQYPILNERREDFEAYREEVHPKMDVERAAKLFLVDKGLIEGQSRKGLEKPTAGPKTAPTTKWSEEAITDLMNKDYKRYSKLLDAGEFDETLRWRS